MGVAEAGAPDDSSVAGAAPTSDWLRARSTSDGAWFGCVLSDTGLFLRFGFRKQVYGREYRWAMPMLLFAAPALRLPYRRAVRSADCLVRWSGLLTSLLKAQSGDYNDTQLS